MIKPTGGEGPKRRESRLTLLSRHVWKKKTGNPELAELMYQAVRAGGEPYFPTWYRWGYGWPIGRGYQALSLEEEKRVADKIKKFKEGK